MVMASLVHKRVEQQREKNAAIRLPPRKRLSIRPVFRHFSSAQAQGWSLRPLALWLCREVGFSGETQGGQVDEAVLLAERLATKHSPLGCYCSTARQRLRRSGAMF